MSEIVIVGNGVAGDTAARQISDKDGDISVEIFTSESYPFYQRTRVGDVISDQVDPQDLVLHDQNWYSSRGLELHLETTVEKIEPGNKFLYTSGGNKFNYDELLLATGAKPLLPPIEGLGQDGVLTLRTLQDAISIRSQLRGTERAAVIGGGLLGLETAASLGKMGIDTTVIEVLPLLMHKQLDDVGSGFVKRRLEEKGIKFHLDAEARKIDKEKEDKRVFLDTGEVIQTEVVIVSAGVSPRTDLAEGAGLETDRGIVVDENLRTSAEDIYAAGDAIQQSGTCYGIWPPAREQGQIAGKNLVGKQLEYDGSLDYYKLKVADIDLISAGTRKEDRAGEVITRQDTEKMTYKKLFLDEGGRLIGAILVGDGQSHSTVLNGLRKNQDFSKLKSDLGI